MSFLQLHGEVPFPHFSMVTTAGKAPPSSDIHLTRRDAH